MIRWLTAAVLTASGAIFPRAAEADVAESTNAFVACAQASALTSIRRLSPEEIAIYGVDGERTARMRFQITIDAVAQCRTQYESMEADAEAEFGDHWQADRYLVGVSYANRAWIFYLINSEVKKSKTGEPSTGNQSTF